MVCQLNEKGVDKIVCRVNRGMISCCLFVKGKFKGTTWNVKLIKRRISVDGTFVVERDSLWNGSDQSVFFHWANEVVATMINYLDISRVWIATYDIDSNRFHNQSHKVSLAKKESYRQLHCDKTSSCKK
ncbi:hypothetical protein GCM10026983_06090 [Gracilibacillus alcaliphilus]